MNYQEALAEPLLDINGQPLSVSAFYIRLKKFGIFTNIFIFVMLITAHLPIIAELLPITILSAERFTVILLIIETIIAAVVIIRLNVYLRCHMNISRFATFCIVYTALYPFLITVAHIDYSLLFLFCVAICSIALTLIIVISNKIIKLEPAKALIRTGFTLILVSMFSFNLFRYINISYDTSPQILLSKVDSDCSCKVTVTDAITGNPKNIEISAGDYNVGDTVKISHGNGLLNSPWYQEN